VVNFWNRGSEKCRFKVASFRVFCFLLGAYPLRS
jgi:hypothetical protein